MSQLKLRKGDVKRFTREELVELLADMFVRMDELQPGSVTNQAELFQDALERYEGYPTQPPTESQCQWCSEQLDNGEPLADNGKFHQRCYELCSICTRTLD